MVEKNLEAENKELKRKLEEAYKQLASLNVKVDQIHNNSEKQINELNDDIDDLEVEIDSSVPIPKQTNEVDYEQKSERSHNYGKYLFVNKIFGWEKIKEFKYRNGDYRFTMRRNRKDPNYQVWKENEDLYETVRAVQWIFHTITEKLSSKLHATFEDVAAEPDFQLTGWRKFWGIRKRGQKAEIHSRVNEINKAYDVFKEETAEVIYYLYKQVDDLEFVKKLENASDKVHPDKSYILQIMERYRISYKNGQIAVDIGAIEYDFSEKRVELVSNKDVHK